MPHKHKAPNLGLVGALSSSECALVMSSTAGLRHRAVCDPVVTQGVVPRSPLSPIYLLVSRTFLKNFTGPE